MTDPGIGQHRRITITGPGEKLGLRARRAARRRAARIAPPVTTPEPTSPLLPAPDPIVRWWGRLGQNSFWGPMAPVLPPHQASTARAGILAPFGASQGSGCPGPLIGVTSSGQGWTWDLWEAYGAGLTTSTGVIVTGLMGYGKSMFSKTAALRWIAYGRQVIVLSDIKGEWTPIAQWMDGGQVLRLGGGVKVNPLDAGTPPTQDPDNLWPLHVLESRISRVRTICSILRAGREFTSAETIAITLAVEEVSAQTDGRQPTLSDLVEAFRSPSADMLAQCYGPEAAQELAMTLSQATKGELGAMFDGQSTVQMRPDAPMVVVDTSVLAGTSAEAKIIASECLMGWIWATLRRRDGRFRVLISEEGWESYRYPEFVASLDELLRLSGHYGVALMQITHEMSDQKQFGDPDSAHRNRLEALLRKCDTQVFFHASDAEAAVLKQTYGLSDEQVEQIRGLLQGWALVRIGGNMAGQVRAIPSWNAYTLFDTSTMRKG